MFQKNSPSQYIFSIFYSTPYPFDFTTIQFRGDNINRNLIVHRNELDARSSLLLLSSNDGPGDRTGTVVRIGIGREIGQAIATEVDIVSAEGRVRVDNRRGDGLTVAGESNADGLSARSFIGGREEAGWKAGYDFTGCHSDTTRVCTAGRVQSNVSRESSGEGAVGAGGSRRRKEGSEEKNKKLHCEMFIRDEMGSKWMR